MPVLSIIKIPILFYSVAFLFFIFGLWVAWETEYHRLSQIFLAFYKVIFHVIFVAMIIVAPYSTTIEHNLSMICVMLLFVAALHELTKFFFDISLAMVHGSQYLIQNIIR